MTRENQRLRTRKDLLEAGARLLRRGEQPTMGEVADEAQVSRATAYRYFESVEALLCEAPIDAEVPAPEALFEGDRSVDAVRRTIKAEGALHEATYRNIPHLRAMLAYTLRRGAEGDSVPARQNRRIPLIEEALRPARARFDDATYGKLCASLALIFGTESMVVFEDVLGVGERESRAIKEWAIRTLIRGAQRRKRR